jgi:predicted unusual protein kinase regulating ubiquinone biosynthesis (AarF/ABC1/UbiB family)
MTFIIKSLTTLDGIARALDPQYNLLAAAQPFVKSLATSSNGNGNLLGILAKQAKDFLKYQLQKPSNTELAIRRLESRIETGELKFNVRSVETDRALKSIYLVLKSLIYTCLSGFSFLGGILLLGTNYLNLAIAAFGFSAFWFYILMRSLIKIAIRERMFR